MARAACSPGLSLYLLIADSRTGRGDLQCRCRPRSSVHRVQRSGEYGRGVASPFVTAERRAIHQANRLPTERGPPTALLSADVPAKEGLNAHGSSIRRAACSTQSGYVGHASLRGRLATAAAPSEHHHCRIRPPFDLLGTARVRPAWCSTGRLTTRRSSASSSAPSRRMTGRAPKCGERQPQLWHHDR